MTALFPAEQPLVPLPTQQVESFLLGLANPRVFAMDVATFVHRFSKFLPKKMLLQVAESKAARRLGASEPVGKREDLTEKLFRLAVLSLSTKLRAAWDEPDAEVREWRLHSLRREMDGYFRPDLSDLERDLTLPANAFEQAMRHFKGMADKARHCPVTNCQTPYFFSKKTTQRYCSDECREIAKRESKMRSWKKHGVQWRENARQSHKSTGRKR